jgi:hypothetical protein
MRNKHFIAALLVMCWAFSSCVSFIDTHKMDLTTKNKSGQILNLKFSGDAGDNYSAQAEKLVKNGFINTSGEEYGYYDVRFEVITKDYQPLTAYLSYVPAFWPLFLFGIPIGGEQFTLVAHFYIFDSNGNPVKHYSNTNAYKQPVGIYNTGSSATKKGTQEFTKLFDVIFDEAANESSVINAALEKAGSIAGNSDMAGIQANIDRYFTENPYAQNRK